MTALPVEPGPVPGTGDGTPSPEPSSEYAENLRDLPLQCWDPIARRRYVLLRRRPLLTDDSMCGFVARWTDEDREKNIRIRARSLVQVIGAFDLHGSHPDWVTKNVDPHYEDAKAQRRQTRGRGR